MTARRVLVTGGAGYVGVHSVLRFRERGWHVTTFDNLTTGHAGYAALADAFVHADLRDRAALDAVLHRGDFDGILHCAALAEVAASVAQPTHYFRHNLDTTLNLADAAAAAGCVPIVFSSSAAVYGAPTSVPIGEDHATRPINPYGFTKLACEELLAACEAALGLRSVCLRYFNAAGADPQLRAGERHEPETHAIPNLLEAVSRPGFRFQLFGTDYATPDGTCVRDYIHVADLAEAHALALEHLWTGADGARLNVGSGRGTSVLELVEAVRSATGSDVAIDRVARRAGDPPILVAATERARSLLGWTPVRSGIDVIVEDAWRWHSRRI